MTLSIRHDWTTEEIQTLLELPLMELLWHCLLYTSPSP